MAFEQPYQRRLPAVFQGSPWRRKQGRMKPADHAGGGTWRWPTCLREPATAGEGREADGLELRVAVVNFRREVRDGGVHRIEVLLLDHLPPPEEGRAPQRRAGRGPECGVEFLFEMRETGAHGRAAELRDEHRLLVGLVVLGRLAHQIDDLQRVSLK